MPEEKARVNENAQKVSRFISANPLLITFVFLLATVGTGLIISHQGWDTIFILPITILLTSFLSPLLVSIHQSFH